jgi:hypothetical protein
MPTASMTIWSTPSDERLVLGATTAPGTRRSELNPASAVSTIATRHGESSQFPAARRAVHQLRHAVVPRRRHGADVLCEPVESAGGDAPSASAHRGLVRGAQPRLSSRQCALGYTGALPVIADTSLFDEFLEVETDSPASPSTLRHSDQPALHTQSFASVTNRPT